MLRVHLAEVSAEKFIVVQRFDVYGLKQKQAALVLCCGGARPAASGPTTAPQRTHAESEKSEALQELRGIVAGACSDDGPHHAERSGLAASPDN